MQQNRKITKDIRANRSGSNCVDGVTTEPNLDTSRNAATKYTLRCMNKMSQVGLKPPKKYDRSDVTWPRIECPVEKPDSEGFNGPTQPQATAINNMYMEKMKVGLDPEAIKIYLSRRSLNVWLKFISC